MGVGWDGGTVGRWDSGTVGQWDGGMVGLWDWGIPSSSLSSVGSSPACARALFLGFQR